MKKSNKVLSMVLSLAMAFSLAFGAVSANAQDRKAWMQSIYKEGNTVTVLLKINVQGQYCPEADAGYVYVKDVKTGEVKRHVAQNVEGNKNEYTYKYTYTVNEGQETRVMVSGVIPSGTGHEQEFYDNNGGYWYQA